MKPAAFDYVAPQTVDEALAQLAEHQPSAQVLAGGQSLVPLMNMRAIMPGALIDINGVAELDVLREEDGQLVVGALTRQQQLATSEMVQAHSPLLAEAARKVAFPAIRSRGTLGGSVAHAEPGAQLPLALLTLDAVVILAGQGHTLRSVPVSAFSRGPFVTALAADELLIELRIPAHSPTAGYAVQEYRRGHTGPPLVAVAAVLELAEDGTIRLARLSMTGVAEVPLRLRAEEGDLVGNRPTAALFDAVAERAAAQVRRGDAVLADVPLRQRITQALVGRVLGESHRRALQQLAE
jgi:CO/xanthine dehydrogenase FAD-binding subunit